MTSSKNPSDSSAKKDNLYAIAETSGQQFWFEVDKYYDIDRLNACLLYTSDAADE